MIKPVKLRKERQKRGWTQEYVGEQIGIKKVTIHQLETGKRNPSYDVLIKLENLFHMSHRQLFAVIDDENSPQEYDTTA